MRGYRSVKRGTDGTAPSQRPWKYIAACALLVLQEGWTSLAYGAKKRLTEAQLCQLADIIVIGTVAERESYYEPPPGRAISSTVRLRVESVIHGAPPPVMTFRIEGGVVGGRRTIVEDEPISEVGSRYLMLFAVSPRLTGSLEDQLVLYRWFALDPDKEIPGDEELGAIWNEHCGPPGSTQNIRPTERYLPLLPDEFLDWCKHY